MKISRATKALTAAALATILLTGCGGVPADGGSYGSATELKDAFVKAGGQCEGWEAHNNTKAASTSGSCGDSHALSVFDDRENKDLMADMFRSINTNAVIGKNWIFSTTDSAAVHKMLGGELLSKK